MLKIRKKKALPLGRAGVISKFPKTFALARYYYQSLYQILLICSEELCRKTRSYLRFFLRWWAEYCILLRSVGVYDSI